MPDIEETTRQLFLIADETDDHADGWNFSETRDKVRSAGAANEVRELHDKLGIPYELIYADMPESLRGMNIEYQRGYLLVVCGLAKAQLNTEMAEDEKVQVLDRVHHKVDTIMKELLKRPPDECLKIIRNLAKTWDQETMVEHLSYFVKSTSAHYDDVRPYARYLLSDEQQLRASEEEGFFEGTSDVRNITGSELIARYFSQGQTVAEHGQLPPMAIQLGRRRIEHAVNYQATEQFIWLRELTQNAFNVTRERGVEPRMGVWDSYSPDRQYRVTVEDPVGMTFDQLLNNLLIPQRPGWESQIKDAREKVWGQYGHGFFTVFRDADIVRLKTSVGDGQVILAEIRPVRENGKVIDLECQIAVREEE